MPRPGHPCLPSAVPAAGIKPDETCALTSYYSITITRNLQGEIYKKAKKYFAEFRRHPAAAQLRGLPVWPARPEDEPKRNLKYGDFVHFTFKVKSYILFYTCTLEIFWSGAVCLLHSQRVKKALLQGVPLSADGGIK